MSGSPWVLLARLVRPQGRKGEIIADLFTDFPQLFADRRRLFLLKPNADTPQQEVTLERHWMHQGRIVFKFAGIDSINDAEPLRGLELVLPTAERAPLDQDSVYIADLIGCQLFDLSSNPATLIGEVSDVERGLAGAPDLLVIRSAQRPAPPPEDIKPRRGRRARSIPELLIPFAKAHLVSVDTAHRRIEMRLPAGLADLNQATPADKESSPADGQA